MKTSTRTALALAAGLLLTAPLARAADPYTARSRSTSAAPAGGTTAPSPTAGCT